MAASGADLKVWARLFLAGRLTGSTTFVLKRYSYTPPFVPEFNFSSLEIKNQFPNEVKVFKNTFYKAVHPK